MYSRLRIRLLLLIAACVLGAGIASATIQRSASNADLREHQAVTQLRLAMLHQHADLQTALRTRSADDLSEFHIAHGDFLRAATAASDPGGEAEELELIARERKLGLDWSKGAAEALAAIERGAGPRAARGGDARRSELLHAFLDVNDERLDELAEKRDARQRRALLLPIGLVGLLTLLSAGLLWAGAERPARIEERRRHQQGELGEALQVARTEPEAYDMLARHITRASRAEHVTVLNRNNSADRLEPVTPVREGSQVAAGLQGAAPDSCLAVRMARSHQADPGDAGLLSCDVCGRSASRTTCVPSLVGGEVIGAVLVEHSRPMPARLARQVSDSVAEAAPVVANLRNLAIAQMRAATDGLTGLPNQRAVHDTLKRMVAQAGRTVEPLAVVLFDLDHFKRINDRHGHGRGDDVLAAVGDVAAHTVRASDFVGRFGGEEFAVLLPGTNREGALRVAENLREAIATIQVTGVDERVSASFGVAVLPEDAPDAQTLLRIADHALYQAKANGRDRVETAAT